MTMTIIAKRTLAFATLTMAALALAGCTSAAAVSTHTPEADAAVVPTFTDVWVKAAPELMGGTGMTALFGVFENPSHDDITILGGTADAALTTTKLDTHEVVQNDAGEMVMQEKKDGIVIPAHGSVTLKPGSYHIMFWDLKKPIAVGDTITITVNFSNGTSATVDAVARDIANANETYDPKADTGATPAPSSTMNMG
ncbi:copper chaperone PCu(A)C [Alpinimonas psychrophila]|uniref:Copper chaperone PCu(A)C n=1 Tax=Alpinimonas psychrophila TaxID=748908 RepID=A0A7W3JTQ8_9MICO|nr:copper chaperone PCu(A)C [Alpinimonas psychrophila]MBA8829106.1 hypothetical protein [Alpinimonas psychrophila]